MSALEIILLLGVLILGGLFLFELYKRKQMERQLNRAQSELHDTSQKMSALNEAFSTRRVVEGNLGAKLRDLSNYIEDVQTTYATELDANTALVSSFKAELNAPKMVAPPRLSEDNQADDMSVALDEPPALEPELTQPDPKESEPKTEGAKTEVIKPESAEPSQASEQSAPAPISMEVQAPMDTHVDKKVTS